MVFLSVVFKACPSLVNPAAISTQTRHPKNDNSHASASTNIAIMAPPPVDNEAVENS